MLVPCSLAPQIRAPTRSDGRLAPSPRPATAHQGARRLDPTTEAITGASQREGGLPKALRRRATSANVAVALALVGVLAREGHLDPGQVAPGGERRGQGC